MPISVADLCEAAETIFNVSRREIRGFSRFPHIYRARAAVCAIAHLSGHSYAEIGRQLGGRDKSTIAHAYAHAEEMDAVDLEFSAACVTLLCKAREWEMRHAEPTSGLLEALRMSRPANDNPVAR